MRNNKGMRRLAGGAAGLMALLVLTSCNPAPGQANIIATGAVEGRASGRTVTCTRSGTTVQADWRGVLDGRTTNVRITLRRSDGWSTASLSHAGEGRGYFGYDLTTADADGTLHWDHPVGVPGGSSGTVHLKADLRCP